MNINAAISHDCGALEEGSSIPLGYQVIRSLEIENFRCFKMIELRDVRRFCIITGENASGKTALLEALFVAGGNAPEIYLRTSIWRGKEEFPLLPTTPSQLLPVIEDYFFQFDVTKSIRVHFRDSNTGVREIRVVAIPQEVLSLPFDPKSSEAAAPQPSNLKFSWETPKGKFEAEAEATPAGLRIRRPDDVYYMVFLHTASISSARENADRFSALSAKGQEKPIVDAVKQIFPQVQDLTVLTSSGGPAIHASVRGLIRKIPLGLLSAGVNKFVAILCAISSVPRGAVLVDEIENGWHYKSYPETWQVISDCASDNHTQLFVTTHSKEFLESIVPIVNKNEKDYCLIRAEKINSECSLSEFSGREFGSAVSSGVEVR